MEQDLKLIFGNYQAWEAKEGTWFINFMNGTQNMYLLEGKDKALLIDTGYGTGTLRAYVETLTKKPVTVVNTHFHPDHSGGNGEFEEAGVAAGWETDAPSVFGEGAVPFDLSLLPYPDYKKHILKEGDEIDLGGRIIKVMDVKPAHCNSSLFFYDTKEKMIFTGDEMECQQTLMFDNSKNPDAPYDVKKRLDNLKANAMRLRDMGNEIEWVLPNHNGFPIAKSYIDDYISLVDDIYSGKAVIEDKLNHPFIEMDPEAAKLCRIRYGKTSIFIKKAEVLKVYGI